MTSLPMQPSPGRVPARRGLLSARNLAASAAALALLGGASVTLLPGTSAQAQNATVQAADPFASGYADLVEKVLPAVVNVSVEGHAEQQEAQAAPEGSSRDEMEEFFRRFFGPNGPRGFGQPHGGPGRGPHGGDQRVMGQGSGFIIDQDGWIVTNAHVAGGADKISVSMQDGTTYPAELKGIDEKTDLALLKVDAGKPLPHVVFGDSAKVRVGDKVLAVGNPFGLGGTVTSGIVSATGREVGSGPYDDFLQLDAPINRGNSGGPTFNLAGEVIGVNSMIFSPSGGSVGIGFAISSNLAKEVISDLRDDGRIERGWLGVAIQGMDDDLKASLGLSGRDGALVQGVEPNSPAAKAGIEQGDVILQLGDTQINRLRALTRAVADVAPGTTVPVKVWRDGKEVTVDVAVGSLPTEQQVASDNSDGPTAGQPRLGLALAPIPPQARSELQLAPDASGVLVAGVQPGSPAQDKGLEEGDVILTVQDQPVADPGDVSEAVKAAHEAGLKAVRMLVQHEGQTRYVAVPIATS